MEQPETKLPLGVKVAIAVFIVILFAALHLAGAGHLMHGH
jgi:hypothetical protein